MQCYTKLQNILRIDMGASKLENSPEAMPTGVVLTMILGSG